MTASPDLREQIQQILTALTRVEERLRSVEHELRIHDAANVRRAEDVELRLRKLESAFARGSGAAMGYLAAAAGGGGVGWLLSTLTGGGF